MTEKEFWMQMEYRVCSEIAGLAFDEFRGLRCEGFIPNRLGLVGDRQAIIGTVRLDAENDQQSWHFAFLLKVVVQRFEEIDWAKLLPAENVTGWLSLTRLKKEMKIDLDAAYPDLRADS